jgi:hypothetical protein
MEELVFVEAPEPPPAVHSTKLLLLFQSPGNPNVPDPVATMNVGEAKS